METRNGGKRTTGNDQLAETISKIPQSMEEIARSILRSNNEMIQLFQNINNDLIQEIQQQSELTRRCIINCFENQKQEQTTANEDNKEIIDTLSKETRKCIEQCTEKMVLSIQSAFSTK